MIDPTGAVLAGQQAAEDTMQTPCRLRRPTGETTDAEGRVVATYAEPDVYAGRCKVQDAGTQSRGPEVGESDATVTALELHLPVSAPAARTGDVVQVLAGTVEQPGEVLRTFRVERPHRKTWQTAQRVPVTETEGLV